MTRQFINSLNQIVNDPHTSTFYGFYRHGLWQVRKIVNSFPCVVPFSQSRIIAFHKRCGVSALINSRNLYNFNNFMFIKHILKIKDGGVFFDIGANIGAYTIIAKEQKNVTAYTFEPHYRTFEYLQKNIDLNRLTDVFAFNLAVGNENKKIVFSDDPGSSENKVIADEKEGIHVQSIRLENYLKQKFLYPVFVKIDVEGFELQVLQGCGDYLSTIDVFQIEIHDLNHPGEKTKGLLKILVNNFDGPFFVNYDKKTIMKQKVSPGDDPIFISKTYLPELKKYFQFCDL